MAVSVGAQDAEQARAQLLELAPAGFEEIEHGDGVDLVVYTDRAGAAAVAGAFPGASITSVEPGWEERWREFHHAVRAGGLWIGPPWEAPPGEEPAVVVDPGRAFGTGAHPTTRACLELLARQERKGVLDAGCGSGVLALAAVRLGFGPVVAVDADEAAVSSARENAARNGILLDVRRADVLDDPLPSSDLLVANIELATVGALLARAPAPRAITSGYLAGESPPAGGWAIVDELELEGWAAHVLVPK